LHFDLLRLPWFDFHNLLLLLLLLLIWTATHAAAWVGRLGHCRWAPHRRLWF
jgi:hypothetical protein